MPSPVFQHRGRLFFVFREIRQRYATGEEGLEVIVAVYQLGGEVVRLVLKLLGDDVGVAVQENSVHSLVDQMVGQFVGADEALLLLVQI